MHRLLPLLLAPSMFAEFRAAVVKIDITPKTPQPLLGYAPRQSTGVHDPLFHRILAMDDGATRFYLIATDICLVSPSVYDEIAADLDKQLGISRLHVWWSFSHTHSAPEVGPPGLAKLFLTDRYDHQPDPEYGAMVKRSIVDGVKRAKENLAPAVLRVGTGFAMANINRRGMDMDGSVKLGLNPYGPVDRQIGLLRVDRADGSMLALVANYAIHGTALGGQNKLISGDVPGVVASYVEEKLGTTMLFTNGAAGNIAPIYSVYPDFRGAHITEFNVLLGNRIIQGARAMTGPPSAVRFTAGEKIVETPRKHGLGWSEDLPSYTKDGASGPLVRLPLRFLRVDEDTVLWSAPLEMFCELAIAVRERSPFANTFYFGYTNGWMGYLPTRQGFAEGGYEPRVSAFTDRAGEDVVEAAVTYVQGLRSR